MAPLEWSGHARLLCSGISIRRMSPFTHVHLVMQQELTHMWFGPPGEGGGVASGAHDLPDGKLVYLLVENA